MIYGYCRCSTDDTKQDIDRQKRELKQMGATDRTIYAEYISGSKTDRVELNNLIAELEKNPGSTLVTTEVSRITRSTKHLCEIIEMAQRLRLKLIIGSFVVDCTNAELDPMTEGMLKMMGVFAEMERKMTISRIKSGLANAKAKGITLGRPKTTTDSIPTVFYKYYPRFKSGEITKKELSRLCELSYPTIYKYLAMVEQPVTETKSRKKQVKAV